MASVASQSAAPGSEIVVEVETNRPYVHNHAAQLRFRVTNNQQAACGITIRMRLHGQGRFVEQDAAEMEQSCEFHNRGDQYVFSFPFRGLVPGEIPTEQLRVDVTRPDTAGERRLFELPDRSLFVSVSDPTIAANAPGTVISGGINIEFSQLKEMYGPDIKDVLNLNAQRQADDYYSRNTLLWGSIPSRKCCRDR